MKKRSSNLILNNKRLSSIDKELQDNSSVLAHKLCGAGNGGFFLVFARPNTFKNNKKFVKITISNTGVSGRHI